MKSGRERRVPSLEGWIAPARRGGSAYALRTQEVSPTHPPAKAVPLQGGESIICYRHECRYYREGNQNQKQKSPFWRGLLKLFEIHRGGSELRFISIVLGVLFEKMYRLLIYRNMCPRQDCCHRTLFRTCPVRAVRSRGSGLRDP